jgi:uncharacterized damage-inducible protein DinB
MTTPASTPVTLDYPAIMRSQFKAAMRMFADCLNVADDSHIDTPIGKYPFWQVAYHTLCFIDCYLSSGEDEFRAEMTARASAAKATGAFNPQPTGEAELAEEYPSRRFTLSELRTYMTLCMDKFERVFAAQTPEVLAGPSGFRRLPFTRAELHLYNMRHIMHHCGQLSAALRRFELDPKWIGRG